MKNKISLSRSELEKCRNEFHQHYRLQNGNQINDTLRVKWIELKTIVENHGGIPIKDEIIVRFIHRMKESRWFLTLECCHINSNGLIDFVGNRFDLTESSIVESDFAGQYDPIYADSVLFDGIGLTSLNFAQFVMFPWEQEFVEAARINEVLLDDSINLKFVSMTYDYNRQSYLIDQPHLLAMLFSSDFDGDMIDDNVKLTTTSLINRFDGFNMGNPCPPCCDYYEDYDLFFQSRQKKISLSASKI